MSRRWRTRLLWSVVLAAGVAGSVALGAVRSKTPPVDQALRVNGLLTYVWHGDATRNCAAKGLCGSGGSIIVHFDGYADLTRRGRQGFVSVGRASATARVRRSEPGSQPAECVDAIPVAGVGISLRRVRGVRWLATLDASAVSGGRCAGPLARDLARLRMAASQLRGRALGFDLHGRARFGAGPFSGELISTLVLRPDTSEQSSSSSGSTVFSSPPRPPRHVFVEHATVRYGLSGPSGALTATFAGDAMPYCIPLDDCGVTGTLRMTIAGFRHTLVLSGSRVVPRRVGPRGVLDDVRSGRLKLLPTEFVVPARGASTSETMARPGGAACTDTSPSTLSLYLFEGLPSAGVPITVVREFDATDPWRTHCPGPTTADITGTQASGPFSGAPTVLARGVLPTGSVGSDHVSVVVRKSGQYRGNGYSGTRGGALTFALTLAGIAAGTTRETER